jgi:hypothetical protein
MGKVKGQKSKKVKLSLGNGGIATGIIYLGTRWRWAVGFTLRSLYSPA